MESESSPPSIWGRAAGDPAFRQALIDDPLRALAEAGETGVSSEQIRRLEAMDAAEREGLITEVLRRIAAGHVRQQWGDRFWTPDEPGPTPGEREG